MLTKELKYIFLQAVQYAKENYHEYLTIEHIFIYILDDKIIKLMLENFGMDIENIQKKIKFYIDTNTPRLSELTEQTPIYSLMIQKTIDKTLKDINDDAITPEDLFVTILQNNEIYGTYLLKKYGLERIDIVDELNQNDLYYDNDENGKNQTEKKNNTLKNNCTELVKKSKNKKIDPVIGRDKEIRRIIEILARRKKNNPILLGEAGVGKTTVIEGLSNLIAKNDVPEFLKDAKIYSVDMGNMIAGTKYRGDFEKKLKNLIHQVTKEKNSILFIDEIHTIIGAGSVGDSSMDASNILKPLLSSGELRCIGATTHDEYKKSFGKDKAFSRRFGIVNIKEPSIDDSTLILKGLKKKYEKFHGVKYKNEAINLISKLSKRYITNRYLPDSAIDVLDEAGAKAKIYSKQKDAIITAKNIKEIVSKIVGIPQVTATKTDIQMLQTLDTNLKKEIFGQDKAIDIVTKIIKTNRAGLGEPNKIVGSFLFTGTTGTGKTEVAKILAKNLGIHFERFDMSEYSEAHTISKLIGAPAGYVGYENGGILTKNIKKNPHCVLLLDEIEKAHPNLMNLLLQVMDNATLSDNLGEKTDFQNVILIMTSNLGTKNESVMGFNSDKSINENKEIKEFFSPEFRNRLDSMISFNTLSIEIVEKIVEKFVQKLQTQIKEKKIVINVSQKAIKQLAVLGYSSTMGARPLQRIIDQKLKEPLTNEILFGKLKNGGTVDVNYEKEVFNFEFDELKKI